MLSTALSTVAVNDKLSNSKKDVFSHFKSPTAYKQFGDVREVKGGKDFGNCPPTRPLSQHNHFSTSLLGQNVGLGEG